MKGVVRLAILVAALLLVTNMAFAALCDVVVCYDIVYTSVNGASHPELWTVCLNDDGTGDIAVLFPLALFGDGPLWGSFDAHPTWTTWVVHSVNPPVSGYIWTDIYGMFLHGEGYSGPPINERWKVTGKKVPCI
jgi:hypothetical protein